MSLGLRLGLGHYMWIFVLLAIACHSPQNPDDGQDQTLPTEIHEESNPGTESIRTPSVQDTASLSNEVPDSASNLEFSLKSRGLVDVQQISPNIRVDLRYSSDQNFLNEDVYGTLNKCYLQLEVANMLSEAQKILKSNHPNLNLLVFDGARPLSVQYKMWEIVKGTEKERYVATPSQSAGSMHNYGAAVDVGLIDDSGNLIDMGTPYDYFGPEAQPRYETKFLEANTITQEQLKHRYILRKSMKAAGFKMILSEWWHFNAFSKNLTRNKYEIIP